MRSKSDEDEKLLIFGWITTILDLPKDGNPDKYNELTDRLHELLKSWRQAACKEAEKAYGGCHNCFGKGFSTFRHGETYRGTTHNEGTEVKFCTCDRGKQLEKYFKEAERAAREDELITLDDTPFKTVAQVGEYIDKRIAVIQRDREEKQ